MGKITWLDKALMKYEDLTEEEVLDMLPEDKVEKYLNSISIFGYGSEIISVVLTAYGLKRNDLL